METDTAQKKKDVNMRQSVEGTPPFQLGGGTEKIPPFFFFTFEENMRNVDEMAFRLARPSAKFPTMPDEEPTMDHHRKFMRAHGAERRTENRVKA